MSIFPRLIPTAEPFYFPGNKIGCILVHGFTGTPKEMRWLGEFLNEKSVTVIAPRLAGHATEPGDMQRSNWQDWVASVEDAYHIIRPNVEKLFIIGLSMGGILACVTASYLKFDGLITISTPYEIPQKDWRLRFIRQFALMMPKVEKGPGDWHNLDAEKDHVDYPYQPTRSVAELLDMFAHLQISLPKLRLPSFHIHSTQDKSVPAFHLQKIVEKNGSANKRTLIVNNSGHVVIREPDCFQVFEEIFEFISNQ
ncbi:MAG: alpha/beta fold hydrolase [Anaerolineaceae bacterium]|nr:alpha/beta fold hydrolase [Anaerolineaceae bacterium]